MRPTIEEYALALAKTAATRSEDQHNKVGCALIRHDKTIAALGYNGAPPGIEVDWSDRAERRVYVVHAEQNALRYVRPGEIMLLATTLMPCINCVPTIASYGIKRVVYASTLDPEVYDTVHTQQIAALFGIEMEQI
jgi:dCMP deaminase